jgi:hypothetical protein
MFGINPDIDAQCLAENTPDLTKLEQELADMQQEMKDAGQQESDS